MSSLEHPRNFLDLAEAGGISKEDFTEIDYFSRRDLITPPPLVEPPFNISDLEGLLPIPKIMALKKALREGRIDEDDYDLYKSIPSAEIKRLVVELRTMTDEEILAERIEINKI